MLYKWRFKNNWSSEICSNAVAIELNDVAIVIKYQKLDTASDNKVPIKIVQNLFFLKTPIKLKHRIKLFI
jgi:hypothetical protein